MAEGGSGEGDDQHVREEDSGVELYRRTREGGQGCRIGFAMVSREGDGRAGQGRAWEKEREREEETGEDRGEGARADGTVDGKEK